MVDREPAHDKIEARESFIQEGFYNKVLPDIKAAAELHNGFDNIPESVKEALLKRAVGAGYFFAPYEGAPSLRLQFSPIHNSASLSTSRYD